MQCLAWILHGFVSSFIRGLILKVTRIWEIKAEGFRRANSLLLQYSLGQNFTLWTGRWDFKHSDTSSFWRLEYIKIPADVGARFADSSSDYPFKQSNSNTACWSKQQKQNYSKRDFIEFQDLKSWLITKNVSKGHGCLRMKNKRKLLTPNADRDGRTNGQGLHLMPFPPFFEWRGHKKL